MKICVISSTVFSVPIGGYGGLEVIAWETAKGLAAKGHEVTLIAPAGSSCPGAEVFPCLPPGYPEEAAYGGCMAKDSNGQDVRWPGYWSKLLEFNNGGVVIDHSWQKWAYMLKAEGRLTCPLLGVCHAPVNTMYGSLPPVEKPCIVCISEDQKQHYEALFSPSKALVCYNGADVDFYKPLDVPRSDRFLFLARFSSIKGAAIALDVCRKTDTCLDLVGDTQITGEPEYYQMCCQMADGVKRKIIGGVPRGETVWYYSAARAFLHPNKFFREPFGLAPVEAQLCGLPVGCWDFGAMRETVAWGETGYAVNSQEELEGLIRDGAFDEIKRSRCREWASQFSLQKTVDRYEQLCIEALDSGGW